MELILLIVYMLCHLSLAGGQLTQDGSGQLAFTSYEFLLPSSDVLSPITTTSPLQPTSLPDEMSNGIMSTTQPLLLLSVSSPTLLTAQLFSDTTMALPTNMVVPSFSPSRTLISDVVIDQTELKSLPTSITMATTTDAMLFFPLFTLSGNLSSLVLTAAPFPGQLTATPTRLSRVLPTTAMSSFIQLTQTRTSNSLQLRPLPSSPMATSTLPLSSSEAVLLLPAPTAAPSRLFLTTTTDDFPLIMNTLTSQALLLLPEPSPTVSDTASLPTSQPRSTRTSQVAATRSSLLAGSHSPLLTTPDFFFIATSLTFPTPVSSSQLSPITLFTAELLPQSSSGDIFLLRPMETSEIADLSVSSVPLSSLQPSPTANVALPSLQPSPTEIMDFIFSTIEVGSPSSPALASTLLPDSTRLLSPTPLSSSLHFPSPSPTLEQPGTPSIPSLTTTILPSPVTTSIIPPLLIPLSSSESGTVLDSTTSSVFPVSSTPTTERPPLQTILLSALLDSITPTSLLISPSQETDLLTSLPLPSFVLTPSLFSSFETQRSTLSPVALSPSLLLPAVGETSSNVLVVALTEVTDSPFFTTATPAVTTSLSDLLITTSQSASSVPGRSDSLPSTSLPLATPEATSSSILILLPNLPSSLLRSPTPSLTDELLGNTGTFSLPPLMSTFTPSPITIRPSPSTTAADVSIVASLSTQQLELLSPSVVPTMTSQLPAIEISTSAPSSSETVESTALTQSATPVVSSSDIVSTGLSTSSLAGQTSLPASISSFSQPPTSSLRLSSSLEASITTVIASSQPFLVTSLTTPTSSFLPPSLSSTQPAAVGASSSSSLSLFSSLPSPTPSSIPQTPAAACPTLLQAGEDFPSSSLVQLRFGLTFSQHSLISQTNSAERCELEEALASTIFVPETKGLVMKRQSSRSGYDADITDVGQLAAGTSLITFYVINGTDPDAPPTFIHAATVMAAIEASNLTQVLTYPIIGVEAPPTSSTPLTLPLAAGLGVALFLLLLVAVALVIFVSVLCYKSHSQIKVETIRGAEGGSTFARTEDFGHFSEDPSTPVKATKSSVSISQLANGWVDGGQATPTIDRDTPSSRHEPIPAGLFERVAHYESATPPQPSPASRVLKMKFHNSVAPSPSTSHKSHSSEAEPQAIRATPTALKPRRKSAAIVKETVQSKEETLRLQEQHEEEELKARRKATLERLMLQSRQRDSEIRSRIGSRRRKRHGSISMDTRVRPSTYGGAVAPSFWETREPEMDAAMGDVDSSSPFATPHPHDVMATTPRPSTRPSTKRRTARRKANKVAPEPITDDYDSTDHTPHPYHMMMDPRGNRRHTGSRLASRQKHGRSQRGRPFSREPSQLASSGRRSRAVAREVHRELAWMETPGGVQLMRIQPIMPAAAVAPPTYTLPPPHPTTASGQIITVQPRPHPKAMAPRPHHSTLENLPTLAPPPSQNFSHKQLETLWREIEKFQLDQTLRRDSTATMATPAKKATSTEQTEPMKPKTKSVKPEAEDSKQPRGSGEVGETGAGSKDVSGEEVKSKEKTADSSNRPQANENVPSSEHHPATPLGSAPPIPPDVDSSYSSAIIQELLQQAFSASQSQGAGQTWARSTNSNYQDSMDSGAHVLLPQATAQPNPNPATAAWHTVTSQPQPLAPPTQMYATPPTHYSGLPGQLVWAPPDPHSFTPLHSQVISSAQLSHLRQSQSLGHTAADYDQSTLVNYSDPYRPAPPPTAVAAPQYHFSPYSRYQQQRMHDPFS